jgi:outer membrane receptor protein involved in Fe transport
VLDESDLSTLNRTKNNNQSYNQEITLQADYQSPITDNQMIEFGGKNISRKVSSDYQYLFADGPNGSFVPSTNNKLSNNFNYLQNVTAGYLSYTLSAMKYYSLIAGARYEYTTIKAYFQNESDIEIPAYGVLVPSINLSRKLGNGGIIKAAYNRRIQRPSIEYLNPNIQASNPLYISMGNPNLGPEYTNNYELAYSMYVKGSGINISSFARNTNNSIQNIRNVIGSDTISTTYLNVGREASYGMSLFGNLNITNKISINGGTDIYYAVLNNNDPNPLYNAHNEGWVASYRLFGSYTIAKGWGIQFFGFYRGRRVQLQGSQGGFGIYSLSLQKEFLDKKASIGIGAENFLTSAFKVHNEVISPTINQNSTTTFHNMNFKINFSYRIGKLSMGNGQSKRNKSINNDDLKMGDESNPMGVDQQQVQGQGQRPANNRLNRGNKTNPKKDGKKNPDNKNNNPEQKNENRNSEDKTNH